MWSGDTMAIDVEQERDRLRRQYDAFIQRLASYPRDEMLERAEEGADILDRLYRTYYSLIRWLGRSFWRRLSWIWHRLTPARDIQERPFEPFGPSTLMLAITNRACEAGVDRIEVTPDNLADWLDEDTRSRPGFDAAACFRTLNSSLYPAFSRVHSGRAHCCWFEATTRDRVIVYVPAGNRRDSVSPAMSQA
jgi:hypothetical protein